MTVSEVAKQCNFTMVTSTGDKTIQGAFAGDLLSWAMSRVEENNIWFTVMGNINTVAVASLSDCACVVLCHNATLSEDAKQRAEKEDVCILKTALSEYDAITLYNSVANV